MQRFRFALDSVLQFRQAQLDQERVRLESIYAALSRLDAEHRELEGELVEADRQAKTGVIEPLELLALDSFSRYAGTQYDRIERQKAQASQRLAEQQQRVVDARRNFELLDSLKGRKKADWVSANKKEQEELASELYLSRRDPDPDLPTTPGAAA